jgi:NAD(P)-dependent dehydrogenase (short-subunit alcohol dehydrogenase family)
LNFDDLNWEQRKYQAWRAYGDSKLANLYFTYELARKLKLTKQTLFATAAHPGLTASNLAKGPVIRGFNFLLAQDTVMGALPTLMAATEPSVRNGSYFGPSGVSEWRGFPRRVFSNRLSHDAGIAQKLWRFSEEMTGVSFPF